MCLFKVEFRKTFFFFKVHRTEIQTLRGHRTWERKMLRRKSGSDGVSPDTLHGGQRQPALPIQDRQKVLTQTHHLGGHPPLLCRREGHCTSQSLCLDFWVLITPLSIFLPTLGAVGDLHLTCIPLFHTHTLIISPPEERNLPQMILFPVET